MKIISLNCWGGKLYEPLVRFIQDWSGETDIFCFQEMIFGGPDKIFSRHNLRGQLFENFSKVLIGYKGYGLPFESLFGLDNYNLQEEGAKTGQAIFVKKEIKIDDNGPLLLCSSNKNADILFHGICQHIDLNCDKQNITVLNIHGLWQGGKGDTPERIKQSQKILNFIKEKNQSAIAIGDFNLMPKTRSIGILGQKMRNLIDKFGIATTRNKFYTDMEKYKDYITDYAFVTSDISVKDFKILKDEISDHLPIFLDFE